MKLSSLILLITFIACRPDPDQNSGNPSELALEESALAIQQKERRIYTSESPITLECLMGEWQIDSILMAGGTNLSEDLIQDQMGNKISFNPEVYNVSFLGNKIRGFKPKYNFETLSTTDAESLRGTSFYHNYQIPRDSIIQLIVQINNIKTYYEVIHCNELIRYYDGRLFRCRKVE